MSDDIPFSTFVGHLKSLRTAALDDVAKAAIEHAFPSFSAAPRSGQISAVHFEKGSQVEHADVMAPYLFRRFAGQSSLPRGRYYSVSDGPDGNDKRTLLHELLAYYETEGVSGPLIVFDGRDEEHRDYFARVLGVGQRAFDKDAIILAFIGPDGSGTYSPFFQLAAAEKDRQSLAIVPLPYHVDKVSIESVIDLRLSKTRKWLEEQLRIGVPGCLFAYGGVTVNGLVVDRPRPAQPKRDYLNTMGRAFTLWKMSDFDASEATLVWRARRDWDGTAVSATEVDDLHLGLLPFLVYSGHGGSPITEIIGIHLRQLGAAGLIYPSARHDFGVVYRNGQLSSSGGWSFVDYRGLAPPTGINWRIEEPDCWSSPVDYEQLEQAFNTPYVGSWRLMGRGELTMGRYMADQNSLGERLFSDSAEVRTQQQSRAREAAMSRASTSAGDQLDRIQARYEERNYKHCVEGLCHLIQQERLDESMKANPRAFHAFYLLGLAAAKLGDHERAIDAFEKASSIEPDKSDPLANIGNSYLNLGLYDRAVDAYRAALDLNPNDSVAAANIETAKMLRSTAVRRKH